MPYKDPVKKEEWRQEWKRRTKENGYNQWLYGRRKLRFDDAVAFRTALETICEIGETRDVEVARAALKASDRRAKKLGPPPSTLPLIADEEAHYKGDDTLAEALAKLGLK